MPRSWRPLAAQPQHAQHYACSTPHSVEFITTLFWKVVVPRNVNMPF